MDEADEVYLYDPALLSGVDLTKSRCNFNPAVLSAIDPAPGIRLRPLSSKDYDRGFLEILGQLTTVGDISKQKFQERFAEMRNCADSYYITVIVDTKIDSIIGSGTLVNVRRYNGRRLPGTEGMIEDIIVNNSYRGKQLGKILIASLVELARVLESRQVGLNCKDPMIKFYEGFGFHRDSDFMMLRVPSEKASSPAVGGLLSSKESMFNPELICDIPSPPDAIASSLKVRPLCPKDLTSETHELDTCSGSYFTMVAYSSNNEQVVAYATVLHERKFIHECGSRASLLGFEVNAGSDNQSEVAKNLLAIYIVELSKKIGCYKMSVRCTEDRIDFYNSVGFKCETNNSNSMILMFDDCQDVSSSDLQGS